jgi:hypothetical protein
MLNKYILKKEDCYLFITQIKYSRKDDVAECNHETITTAGKAKRQLIDQIC